MQGTQCYTFDPMGNRLTKTDSANGNDTYTYNNANMLLSRNGGSYTNDLNGNTLTGGGRSNTWDGQNRLTQVVYNGTTTTHTYGADGLRRRTVQGANTTDYLLDDQSVVRTKLNGNVDKTYLHGARGPEYERNGSNAPVWYLYDGLGSVLGTVDGSGNVASTRKYDVYGAVRASTGGSGPKHKFVGQLGHPSEDETGLIYMRARYYDPVTGRFVSQDPARHGSNWYVYADNAPTLKVDPSGQVPITEILAAYQELELRLAHILASGGAPLAGRAVVVSMFEVEGFMAGVIGKLHAFDDVSMALKWLGQQRPVYEALQRIRGVVQNAQVAEKTKEQAEEACATLLSLFL
ncbi:MAG: RHS repeat domain-containing protein [Armatimonadota bacterium]